MTVFGDIEVLSFKKVIRVGPVPVGLVSLPEETPESSFSVLLPVQAEREPSPETEFEQNLSLGLLTFRTVRTLISVI